MKEPVTRFEQLTAWQKARALTKEIYTLTRKGSLAKDYGVSGQIQRAGVSTMSNIAEGFGRSHLQEKLQFYNVARASTSEVHSLLYVIEDNFSEFESETPRLREECFRCSQLVTGLIRSTEARKNVKTAGALVVFMGLLTLAGALVF